MGPAAQSKYGQELMNCKAAFSAAVLATAAYAVTLSASWPETIAIPSQVDGAKASGVPATVNEAGFDRPATSDHPEGRADSLASGGSSTSDLMALRSGSESGNAPDATGSLAAPEPSTLSKLLFIFSDLRAQVFGRP